MTFDMKAAKTTKLHSGNKGDPLGRLYILPITRFASKWHSEHQRVSRYYFHDHTICCLWIPPRRLSAPNSASTWTSAYP